MKDNNPAQSLLKSCVAAIMSYRPVHLSDAMPLAVALIEDRRIGAWWKKSKSEGIGDDPTSLSRGNNAAVDNRCHPTGLQVTIQLLEHEAADKAFPSTINRQYQTTHPH
jgi:hypothetical protein